MRRARTSAGIAPAMMSADPMMTAYSTQGVWAFPAVLWKPRPRSASATAAATVTPNKTSQTAAHAPTMMRSMTSGGTVGAPRPANDGLDAFGGRGARPPPIGGVSADHQQLVCGASALFDASTVPSLVVIEQLSLLTRNRLDAWTEPTSDCDIGVTVIDQGI